MAELILHEYSPSGNCYKIRLTAALLGLPLERREYDIMKGETRTPDFLAERQRQRPHPGAPGRRPLPPRRATPPVSTSPTASPLIPADRFDRADMLRWMFWEQYNHEPNVATLRFWLGFDRRGQSQRRSSAPSFRPSARPGEAALKLMDEHLAGRRLLRRRRPDASPTSRSTPTPMSPRRAAASASPIIRMSRPGSPGSPPRPATFRSTPDPSPSRRPIFLRPPAILYFDGRADLGHAPNRLGGTPCRTCRVKLMR